MIGRSNSVCATIGAFALLALPQRATAQEQLIPFIVQAETALRVEPSDAAERIRLLARGDTVDVAPAAPLSGGFVQVTTRREPVEGWTSGSQLRLQGAERYTPAFGALNRVQILTPLAFLQVPEPPVVQGFHDGVHWMLRQPLSYRVRSTANTVEVPDGFVTDFASVPRYLQGLIRSTGTYSAAAVVHDYLYWVQPCTKEQADKLFRLAMEESGVPDIMRHGLYLAVKLAGDGAWEQNRDYRNAGGIRVVPEPHNVVPPGITWDDYRARLAASSVAEGDIPIPSLATCAYGN